MNTDKNFYHLDKCTAELKHTFKTQKSSGWTEPILNVECWTMAPCKLVRGY